MSFANLLYPEIIISSEIGSYFVFETKYCHKIRAKAIEMMLHLFMWLYPMECCITYSDVLLEMRWCDNK